MQRNSIHSIWHKRNQVGIFCTTTEYLHSCMSTEVQQQFSISLSVCLSILRAIFPGESLLASTRMSPFWILLELSMMDDGGGGNLSYRKCKAPAKSSSNQHPTFHRPGALLVAQPTVRTEGKILGTLLT